MSTEQNSSIEELSNVQSSATKPLDSVVSKANVESFEDALRKVDTPGPQRFEKVSNPPNIAPSPIEALRESHMASLRVSQPTNIDRLVSEAKNAVQEIEKAKQTLEASSGLQLKSSSQRLLKEKLKTIEGNVKVALGSVGLSQDPASNNSLIAKPILNFLDSLSYSQKGLTQLGNELNHMSQTGKEISPTRMLAIQIKMNTIGQEIELFTSLLSKSIDSTKTVMQVQV